MSADKEAKFDLGKDKFKWVFSYRRRNNEKLVTSLNYVKWKEIFRSMAKRNLNKEIGIKRK